MKNHELQRLPQVVTLCGSTRFSKAFEAANLDFTMKGVIVLSVGCMTQSDEALKITPEQKLALDNLHLRKIDLADSIHVLNVEGYVGASTAREVAYAIATHKRITFLLPEEGEQWLEDNAHKLAQYVAYFTTHSEVLESV